MLPEGWNQLRLGNIFKFKNGLNGDSSLYGSGAKFVNVMDVFRGPRLRHHEIIGEMIATAKQLDEFGIKFGDVLFNRTSETDDEIAFATVYLDDKPAVFGGFVIRARPTDVSLTPEFCTYVFQSAFIRRSMIRLGQGAIRSNIGQGDLTTVPIKFPPIAEQRRIAEILSTWDRAIAVQERLVANARAQKKALMQTLLTGKKRLPGFKGKWPNTSLGKVCQFKGGSGFKEEAQGQDIGDFPFIKVSDMSLEGNEVEIVNSKNWISGNALKELRATLMPARSVVFAKVGAALMLNKRRKLVRPTVIDNNMMAAIPDEQKIKSDYLYIFLTQIDLGQLVQLGAVPSVNQQQLGNIKFCLPPSDEQEAIARILVGADTNINMHEDRLTSTRAEKSALMQQLLTGKRRVKVETKA